MVHVIDQSISSASKHSSGNSLRMHSLVMFAVLLFSEVALAEWVQQAKLVAVGTTGAARQGASVGLSADGNMAIVGAPTDDSNKGGAFIWKRDASGWQQQTDRLMGSSP